MADIKLQKFTWVLASYPYSSDQGKSVLSHANAGIGYKLINQARNKTDEVLVAFKFPLDKPVPPHLTEASYTQQTKLNGMS